MGLSRHLVGALFGSANDASVGPVGTGTDERRSSAASPMQTPNARQPWHRLIGPFSPSPGRPPVGRAGIPYALCTMMPHAIPGRGNTASLAPVSTRLPPVCSPVGMWLHTASAAPARLAVPCRAGWVPVGVRTVVLEWQAGNFPRGILFPLPRREPRIEHETLAGGSLVSPDRICKHQPSSAVFASCVRRVASPSATRRASAQHTNSANA